MPLFRNCLPPPFFLLPFYYAPWLGSRRHKPTAADNAPDGDAPGLPHKQDAQPWGETPPPTTPIPCNPTPTPAGRSHLQTRWITVLLWSRVFIYLFFLISFMLFISFCSDTTCSPFFPSLTKCDCLSQTSQGALLVYSKALLFSSVETLILKIRAPCLCNVCSFWLKCFEHATLKGSAVCHHFGPPHKQVSWMSKHFYFRLQHNTAKHPF